MESNSVSNQKQLIFDFLKSKPEIHIVSIWVDDGYTGTNYDWPAFQLMLEDIKAGLVNCVVVKDLSRFDRDYLEVSSYLELILPVFDIRFLSVNDHFDSNDYRGTTGGDGTGVPQFD